MSYMFLNGRLCCVSAKTKNPEVCIFPQSDLSVNSDVDVTIFCVGKNICRYCA